MLMPSVISILTAFVVLIYSVSANPSGSGSGSGNYWEHQATPTLRGARVRRTDNNEETRIDTPSLRNFGRDSSRRERRFDMNSMWQPTPEELPEYNQIQQYDQTYFQGAPVGVDQRSHEVQNELNQRKATGAAQARERRRRERESQQGDQSYFDPTNQTESGFVGHFQGLRTEGQGYAEAMVGALYSNQMGQEQPSAYENSPMQYGTTLNEMQAGNYGSSMYPVQQQQNQMDDKSAEILYYENLIIANRGVNGRHWHTELPPWVKNSLKELLNDAIKRLQLSETNIAHQRLWKRLFMEKIANAHKLRTALYGTKREQERLVTVYSAGLFTMETRGSKVPVIEEQEEEAPAAPDQIEIVTRAFETFYPNIETTIGRALIQRMGMGTRRDIETALKLNKYADMAKTFKNELDVLSQLLGIGLRETNPVEVATWSPEEKRKAVVHFMAINFPHLDPSSIDIALVHFRRGVRESISQALKQGDNQEAYEIMLDEYNLHLLRIQNAALQPKDSHKDAGAAFDQPGQDIILRSLLRRFGRHYELQRMNQLIEKLDPRVRKKILGTYLTQPIDSSVHMLLQAVANIEGSILLGSSSGQYQGQNDAENMTPRRKGKEAASSSRRHRGSK